MLRLSTKGRYATRIMVCLALHEGDAPARKHEIAAAEEISGDYVEQILMRLRAAGLVQSHRGARGGFALARPADAISVADVLEAAEGKLSVAPCRDPGCSRAVACVTTRVWTQAEERLRDLFAATSIGELAREARAKREQEHMTFHI